MSHQPGPFKSGFASLAGRPNAGKSTLINRIVGHQIAITSEHPQTTRRKVQGIVTTREMQLVIVDTPGVHRPRTLLGERLNDLAKNTWADVDVICWCLAAGEKAGPGDQRLATDLAAAAVPVIAVITKIDVASPAQVVARLADADRLSAAVGLNPVEFVPVSGRTGQNVDLLLELMCRQFPSGPKFFPETSISDQSDADLIAEFIRQAALAVVKEELPHSIAVTVDEMGPRENRSETKPLLDIYAVIHVERDSQKPIIIGKGGTRLRDIGARARADIEELMGGPVYLDLRVRVAKDWQTDPRQLNRLGF